MAAVIDDSCRRPGSIPFKWEICPGTPKHVRSSSASPAPSSSPYSTSAAAAATVSRVAVSPKLTPPPAMSPSPYHSPRVSYYSSAAARSASVSPSRRRQAPQHRPTAFLDVNPRVAPAYRAGHVDDDEAAAPASRCFPLPVFRRRDGSRKGGRRSSGTGTTSGSGSSSANSFWSDYGGALPVPGGLRRSVSTSSSSSCLSLSSRSSGKLAEAREVEAAGGWFY
ncbi:uncharacterized protein [Miscanthus floridulus]|uniref:uncharacterized protein n=1 Tax=Miscanthus floridulus TaxID=154761 RepID=UPI003458F7EB